MSDEKTYGIVLQGDTIEEVAMEFLRMACSTGTFQTRKNDSETKTHAKLVVNTEPKRALDAGCSFNWPDVRLNGLQPERAFISVELINLQKPSAAKQAQVSRAATIKGDIARLLADAKRLGVNIDLNSADGE